MQKGNGLHVLRSRDGVTIGGTEDFDLDKIFDCGQSFRFDKRLDGAYLGVAFGRALRLSESGGAVTLDCGADEFEALWRRYFDCDTDYAALRKAIPPGPAADAAIAVGRGIRILRQAPWETLCTFILSQMNNIPRIRGIVASLCRAFGEKLDYFGETLYTFPDAARIASAPEAALAPLRAGYRAPYVHRAAVAVAEGRLDLEAIGALPTGALRQTLMALDGVGRKVADCVLLFAYHRMDVFPEDVWIGRALREEGEALAAARGSEAAGLLQQYVFYAMKHGGLGARKAEPRRID